MRFTAITLAVLAGSALTTANAQYSSSTPALAKGVAPVTSTHTGGSRLLGGGDDCAAPDAIFGVGSFFFDNSLATTGTQGQNESICYEFGLRSNN